MNLMDRLCRKFRRFSIPNLMMYITATMLVVYVLQYFLRVPILQWIIFDREALFAGQVWRLITFIFMPPSAGILSLILSAYFYYFIGNSLENTWGSTRFTIYYFVGIIGAILSGLLVGQSTNVFLNLSLFFAFAHLYPNHQVMLFFILPIKMKYLAWVNWAFFLISFIQGPMVVRAAVLFSLLNYFLFFGPDLISQLKHYYRTWRRRRAFRKNGGSWR